MELTILELLTFSVLGALAVIMALVAVINKYALYSGLALLIYSVVIGIFYFWIGQEYLGAMQLLIYAGAIMVLILFMIMLLNTRVDLEPIELNWRLPISITIIGILIYFFSNLFINFEPTLPATGNYTLQNRSKIGSSLIFARGIYINSIIVLEYLAILLLLGIVAAVALTKKKIVKIEPLN